MKVPATKKSPQTGTIGVLLEPLEPRLLLSGTWGAGADGPADGNPATGDGSYDQNTVVANTAAESTSTAADAGLVDLLSEAPALTQFGTVAPEIEVPAATESSAELTETAEATGVADDPAENADHLVGRELVLINSNVADLDDLVADLESREGNTGIEVVVLDANRDGIEQIDAILSERSDLAAIHVVTHGSDGQIKLGGTWLNATSLEQNRDAVAAWGQSLTADGDILFYGCSTAAGSSGQGLVNAIADLTEADVAASTDLTGHAGLGGDWDLEYTTGTVETADSLSTDIQQNWANLLAVVSVNTVNDLSDGGDTSSIANLIATPGSDGISLREAIIAANNTGGADEILLPAGTYQLTLGPAGDDAAANGDLDITQDLTITGSGAQNTIVDGMGTDRVFHLLGATVTMSGITVYNGSATDGAGILVDGSSDLTLTNVAVTDNHATATGGGVRVSGVLTTDGVTFEGNSADVGGGLYVNSSGDATLVNTTLSDNTAASNGGAIYTMDTVTITNSTIASNNAGGAGGIHRQGSGSVTLKNSILANNGTNANNSLTSLGYNIDSGNTAGFASTGDQINTDPQLAALGYYGGQTKTHALLAGSAAIDAGDNTGAAATDQRGSSRPMDGDIDGTATVDVGAYEYNAAELTAVVDTWLDEVNTGTNYGGDTTLVMGSHPTIGLGVGDHRILLQFDLSSIPAGSTITGATLRLFLEEWEDVSSISNVDIDVTAHLVNETWQENTATWDESDTGSPWGAVPAADADPVVGTGWTETNPGGSGTRVIADFREITDLETVVQDWLDGVQPNFGIALSGFKGAEFGGDPVPYFTFTSSEGGANAPQLIVSYTPPSGNTAPTATGVPTDVTVTEDTASNFDLSAVTFADVDGDSLTVTLAASSGTFSASSGGGVTIGGSGSDTLTLAGTAANINTYLDTITNIQYTGASDLSGDNAATFTLNTDDGTVNPLVGSGNIDITGTNDAPTASGTYTLAATDEDTTSAAVLVNTILGDAAITAGDNDGDTLGIAVFDTTGLGNWQYYDGGAGSWTDFGAVNPNAALLLSDTTWVRYVPDGVNGESAGFDFRAWDQTTGSASVNGAPEVADTVPGGGTSAFSSGNASVALTVNPLNDEQVLAVNTGTTVAEGSTGNTITAAMLQTTDGDNTADQLIYTVTAVPTHGTLYLNATALGLNDTFTQDDIDNNRITYDHDDSENFSDSFDFDVDDGAGAVTADTFAITITPVNDNDPVATDETITVDQGATITTLDGGATSVLANDTDTDLPNDTLTVTVDTDVVNGTLTLNPDGTFSYTHDGSINLADSFTYVVSDANGGTTATGTVTITINLLGLPPTATNLSAAESYIEDTPLNLTDIQVTDVDSPAVTATLTLSDAAAGSLSTGTSGAVTATFADGVWTASGAIADVNTLLAGVTFTPSAHYDGNLTIATHIDDGVSAPVTGVKTVGATPVGDTPRVESAVVTMNGTSDPIVIRPHAEDGAEVTHFRISNITNGRLTLADGTPIDEGDYITVAQGSSGVRFSPLAASMDPGSFQVEASEDGVSVALQSGAATAVITVMPPPSNPVVDPVVGEETTAEATTEPDAEAAEETTAEATADAAVPVVDEAVLPPPVTAEPAAGANKTKPADGRLSFLIKATRQFSRMVQADAVVTAMVQRQNNTYRSLPIDNAEKPAPERLDQFVRTHNRMTAQVYVNLVNALDAVQEEVAGEVTMNQTVVGSAIAVSTGLSVGYVVWLVRGGMLLSSLLSSIPAWQILDPLPVLAGSRDDRADDDDESLAAMLERRRQESGAKDPKAAKDASDAAESDRLP